MTSSANSVLSPTAAAPPSALHGRMPGLDALRGLAIVLVLFHNFSVAEGVHSTLFKVWNRLPEAGWIGVQIFFVLSGFLITGILSDDKGHPRFYRTFYLRRALRIFPLYYALVLVYGLVRAVGLVGFSHVGLQAICHLTYTQNWSALFEEPPPGLGHLWSLAVEEQFYLVWPLLIGRTSARASMVACLAVIGGSLLFRVGMLAAHLSPNWLYLSTPARADALAIGALLALLLRSPAWRPRVVAALPWVGGLSAAALAVLVLRTHGFNRLNPLMQTGGYTLIALLSGVATARAALRGSRPQTRPGSRVLHFFGKYSYGIYVAHLPIKVAAMTVLGEALRRQVARTPVTVDVLFVAAGGAASVLVALATWRWLERPFLALKDRIAAR